MGGDTKNGRGGRGKIPRGLGNAKTAEDILKGSGKRKGKKKGEEVPSIEGQPGVARTEDGKFYVISNGHLVQALVQAGKEEAEEAQVVGEFIYPYIEHWSGLCGAKSVAPNLTGMLLEMDLGDLLHLTEDLNALNAKLYEAFVVLQQAGKVPPSASTSQAPAVPQKSPPAQSKRQGGRAWGKVDLRAEAKAFRHISGDWPTLPTDSAERAHYETRGKRGGGNDEEEEISDYESDYSNYSDTEKRVILGDDLLGYEAEGLEFFELEQDGEEEDLEAEDLEKERLLGALQAQSKRETTTAVPAAAPVPARKPVGNVRIKKKAGEEAAQEQAKEAPEDAQDAPEEPEPAVDMSSNIDSLISELDELKSK
ncbi:PABC domain-containing protein [Chloropicon primus]|uniref:PABC domain-containing protein n=2 Tax=Chloropicon primus TaxID=1764295 RepID=A0A5B8MED7_9CHLO|nr:hypothetical protein A3770_02p11290 [Chloropicon primus]UPQ97820.1 PABC domain-containing protein [Chloropicon primus]|eukprot:QDZ18611.1 hypothetical protein A3770_02p11290 [Chloropicon primus]